MNISKFIFSFFRTNFNYTPSPSSDSHCESPTSNYNLGGPQLKNGGLSPVIKEEYRNDPLCTASLRTCANNNNGKNLTFTEEQVDCICDSLQQRGDVKKLENFLALYESERPKIALGIVDKI